MKRIVAVLVGLLLLIPAGGIAWADYNLNTNCTVSPQLHYIFDGADVTPAGGMLANGNPVGFICAGSTYVPLRWLAESMGMTVGWDGRTNTITITSYGSSQDGVTFNITHVSTGSTGTVAEVAVANTSGSTRYAKFTLNFVDGYGHVLGTVTGPQGSAANQFGEVQLAGGQTQTVTGSGSSDLSGYVSIEIAPYADACPVACPPFPRANP